MEPAELEKRIQDKPLEGRRPLPEVIPFERHRKSGKVAMHAAEDAKHLTREALVERVQRRKEDDPHLTQAEIARRAGMSQSYLSRLLNGKAELNDKYAQKLYNVLCESSKSSQHRATSHALWGFKKAVG